MDDKTLAQFYSEISKLESKFITSGIEFCKRTNLLVSLQDLNDVLVKIFATICDKNTDVCKIYNTLHTLFSQSALKRNFLNEIFLTLIMDFTKISQNQSHFVTLVNICEKLLFGFNKEQDCTSYASQSQAKSPETFVNFTQIFLRMKNENAKPQFLNLYDGVNIKSEGEILEVGNDFVVFRVDVMQILAMKEEGAAFIVENEYLSKHTKAQIVDFSVANSTVTLANFERIATMNASLRQSQRVHPKKFTPATLKSKSLKLGGSLYDISNGGISVLSEEVVSFEKDEKIQAEFELTFGESELGFGICLETQLVTELTCNGHIRYCLKAVDDDNKSLIESFTNARVEETLDELRKQAKIYR